ncbi:M28 family peptidase [Mucilaginibacter sp. RS28]|uniref:M28 family peptidase n=1 Tax=Mucilaginibacter straminoryzae TaxID=2932774 RepID=A0A9X2BBF8_9SPHI|nr:M28 family peptidase [Mucilaginibacter straminoryzae]MCJ8208173.1 M28 family peptidase [Mucilaginibacter straminoryzae]
MKRILLGAVSMALFNCSYAQKDKTAEKFAQYISVEDAKKHLTILASDEFEGRETAKPGGDKAANYLAGEFKKMGLQAPVNGSYFLDIPLVNISSVVTAIDLNGFKPSWGKDYAATGITSSANVNTNEVVFVGYGSDEDLNKTDLAGKVVLFVNEDKAAAGESVRETVNRRLQALKNIVAKKPALIIAVSAAPRFRGQNGSERLSIKSSKTAATTGTPVVSITAAAADQMLKNTGKTWAQLKESAAQVINAKVAVNYEYNAKDAKAVDVLGFLPGSDAKLKDEVLVFSAHYDHIGMLPEGTRGDRINNGADDDGSGTTGILEIARAFTQAKKQGHGPRRSILFLGNVGEEKGLLGSEYYTDHPVFPIANTITDLNIDMIGRRDPSHEGKPDYCYLIGSNKLSTTLHKISENANNTYTHLDIDYKYNDPKDPERIYYRSDHYNFARFGVPIVFYFDGVHADYHRPSDEVDKIDFPLLVKRAQLVFYTGWDLANRDIRPVVDVSNDMPESR